ncbi:MAG: tetratricopeptide repeat-containing sensor histidine kinase [Prolixibacteraceae bacterium]|nr:tetratricopeptide repeat-containing sensor histidine kinase [Prolixibacteraceae bacterium]
MIKKRNLLILFCLFSLSLFGVNDSVLALLPDTFNAGNPDHYIHFSSTLLNNGEYKAAKQLIDEGIEWGENEKNKYLTANLYYYLADYFYFTEKYQRALDLYKQALPDFKAMADTIMTAKALNSIGLIYNFRHDKENALKYYLEEIELLNNASLSSKQLVIEKVVVLINIINQYSNEGQYEKVIETAPEAVDLALSINDSMRLASIYNVLALAYKNLDRFELSMHTFKKAHAIFSNIDDEFRQAFVELNIGGLYEKETQTDSALSYYNNSYKTFKKYNYAYGIVYALSGMATVYHSINVPDKARRFYRTCIDSCRIYNFNQLLLDAYYGLSELEYEQGRYKEAFDTRFLHEVLNDSLNNLEKEKQFAELQTRYETIQKESEINKLKSEKLIKEGELRRNRLLNIIGFSIALILLVVFYILFRFYSQKKKVNSELSEKNRQIEKQMEQLRMLNDNIQRVNEQLKKSQTELKDANMAKNRFFSILAHDLRSPFHNILGEAYLLSNSYKNLTAEERMEYAGDIYKSCDQLNKLLENLLEWTRTQTNGISFNPRLLNLRKVADESLAILEVSRAAKFIHIENELGENINLKADYTMLETIFRNLLNNSIKFTPAGGKITVSSTVAGTTIVVCVEDTGVGIEKNDLDKLFHIDSNLKTKGTNNEMGTGLGLVICMEFIKYHNGDIWAVSTPGKGSKFYFSFPIS